MRLAPLVAAALLASVLAAAPTAAAGGGDAGPVLGNSIQISRVSGKVTVEPRGSNHFIAVEERRTVPVGSTVNASNGTVSIVAATTSHRARQTADAGGGAFKLTQVPRNPLVTMVLTALRPVKSVCGSANAVDARKKPPRGVISALTVGDHGGSWGTQTGTAAATGRGTEWTTQDTCAGTTFSVEKGSIDTATNKAPLSTALQPKESLAYQCPSNGKCEELLGTYTPVTANGTTVQSPVFGATFITKSDIDDYDLCVTGPSQTGCTTYPLGSPSASGWRRSDVACVPQQGGSYQINWRVNGVLLGLPLTYISPSVPAGATSGCVSVPISRQAVPAGLGATQTYGDFVVHYDDANQSDPNYLTSAQALNVAETAQNALQFETGKLAMPMYLDPAAYPGSTPGTIDVYASASASLLSDTYTWPEVGQTTFPGLGQPSSAYIVQSENFDPEAIAWSVFQVLVDAIGGLGRDDAGLWGSMGTWAAANFDQGGSSKGQIEPPLSEPIDCDESCPGDAYEDQWRFYEHLAEKFGASIMAAILSADAALVRSDSSTGHMDAAIGQVLSADGSSLASELADYAFEDDENGWQETWIEKLPYAFDGNSYTTEPVAATGGAIEPATVVVNHLASHVLELSVAPRTSSTCVADTLAVDMTVPSGGLEPGSTLVSGGSSYPAANTDPTDSTPSDTTTFDSCDGATLDLVFTNGTGSDGMTFGATGNLVYDSGPLSSSRLDNRVVARAAGAVERPKAPAATRARTQVRRPLQAPARTTA